GHSHSLKDASSKIGPPRLTCRPPNTTQCHTKYRSQENWSFPPRLRRSRSKKRNTSNSHNMRSSRITHSSNTLIEYFRKNKSGGENRAVNTRCHQCGPGDKEDDEFFFPLRPVEGVVGVVGGLW